MKERGFALPAVLLVLLLLTIIALGSLRTTGDEQTAGRALRESAKAFYAAESGLSDVAAGWDQAAMDTLLTITGDSLASSWTMMENGCSYRTVIRRVDGGGSRPMYYVTSTGRGVGLRSGQRSLGTMIGTFPTTLTRALLVGGNVSVDGNPQILGECPGAHANGSIGGGGSLIVDGDLSAVDTVTLDPNDVTDSEGNLVDAQSGTDSIPVPQFNPTDYCGDADYHLRNGWLVPVDTPWDSIALGVSAGTEGWGYEPAKDLYKGNTDMWQGTYCVSGNVRINGSPGTKDAPLPLSILATGSIEIQANPFLSADHPENIGLMAGGDVKMTGSTEYDGEIDGFVYAGSQCEVGGKTMLQGQLICLDAPDPPGALDLVTASSIHGDAVISFDCSGIAVMMVRRPLSPRGWFQMLN